MKTQHLPGEFVRYVGRLFALARGYQAETDHDALVLQFLRHREYASIQWRALVGGIDNDFVRVVNESGIEQIESFRDPLFPVAIKVSHLAASCTGVYQYGRPEGTSINRGDIAGWAGDWITFYGDWRREHSRFASGHDFARAKLMRADLASSFQLTDLLEDADAYILGMQLRSGSNIADAVEHLYGSAMRVPRLLAFFNGRFGDRDTAQGAAISSLQSDADRLVEFGRLYLIEREGGFPTLLPSEVRPDKLADFCRGFSEVLLERVDYERKLLGEMSPRR
jgi:hypothetical protein